MDGRGIMPAPAMSFPDGGSLFRRDLAGPEKGAWSPPRADPSEDDSQRSDVSGGFAFSPTLPWGDGGGVARARQDAADGF